MKSVLYIASSGLMWLMHFVAGIRTYKKISIIGHKQIKYLRRVEVNAIENALYTSFKNSSPSQKFF